MREWIYGVRLWDWRDPVLGGESLCCVCWCACGMCIIFFWMALRAGGIGLMCGMEIWSGGVLGNGFERIYGGNFMVGESARVGWRVNGVES